ncbi:hypothetical protein [Pantoea stewartii]|uniref:Uncharacterized protein n=2 Tax=Pantoea stewartii TaxID=66269 RepID=H3R872_PANSE|nr:hypothetical protein [Pantoea stewartii]ARF48859.1 hypothetical protein DSJ_05595 [Pantoea stewartii subsp. stewartii DC283]EHU02208.1 hypothetical protein CKS_5028 [Pantoea stewartii subsp. stewartii DC283]
MLNSPNPVDGDVQALIADCQHDISSINREIDRYSQLPHAIPETLVSLRSQLKRQQIALAALTAEPVAYAHTKVINDLLDKRRCCGTVWIKSDDESSVEPLHALYTTPPAQLLRPVELPEAKDKSQGWKIDPDYLSRIAEHIGDSEEHGAPPCLEHIEAVLLAVKEVKS